MKEQSQLIKIHRLIESNRFRMQTGLTAPRYASMLDCSYELRRHGNCVNLPKNIKIAPASLADRLREIVGVAGLILDADAQIPYLHEWRDRAIGRALAIVRPATTEQVADVVRLCRAEGVAIIPQGGNTGLSGGAIPDESGRQVVLSLTRMSAITEVDASGFTMTVEAGCRLADVKAAALAANRRFGISLASEGSATIGGNIASNAGGIQVLRYGTMRDQLLGLEVVLADGSIWDGCRTLRKNTAGYDLKQYFVGSEGTLGIVTRAVLKLKELPPVSVTALLAVTDVAAAIAIYAALRDRFGNHLSALELISQRALSYVSRHLEASPRPFDEDYAYYILLELESSRDIDLQDSAEQCLHDLMARGLADNALLAKNLEEAKHWWRLRHGISAAQKAEGLSLKHDISLPIHNIAAFHRSAEAAVVAVVPNARPVIFGHIGDGNLHYNVSRPKTMGDEEFESYRQRIEDIIFSEVRRFDGSISAEHGIGRFKRGSFETSVAAVERQLMQTIKTALDPDNLMNPGVLFYEPTVFDKKTKHE